MPKIPEGLYLILSDPVAGYEACAEAAVDCGVGMLQLRMKNVPRKNLIETAKRLREIVSKSATRLIVNDDLEAAMETDADGVHLGQADGAIESARRKWNVPEKLFGLSTHDWEQALGAGALGADYVGVGPVFSTPTKPDAERPLGPTETARIVRSAPCPAFAIGGLNAGTLPELLSRGIRRFCVVGAVNASPTPRVAILELQNLLLRKANVR